MKPEVAKDEALATVAALCSDEGTVRERSEIALHQLIVDARLSPDAVAARCAGHEVTRAEFFATAQTWAEVLADLGCGPQTPVVLLMPRGLAALTAIFAIVRTGSAYVPLACTEPSSRLLSILADCGAPLVLAADELVSRLDGYTGVVLSLSELRMRAQTVSSDRAPARVSLGDLAFIFYTSGTTGEPKGVEGTHRQLLNYAIWCRDHFPHQPGEWTVLHASLSFLGSLTNIFTPLLAGWPIEILPEGSTVDDLLRVTDSMQVGLLKLTPTHLGMMLVRGAATRRPARMVMIASEPLTMTRELAEWMRADPRASFVNAYGMTETHGCLFHWFGLDTPVGAPVPVGTPMSHVDVRIVDEHGNDVATGETGELVVAGDSIGRGYRGRPALTAERWIPDARGLPGSRILRTGDLARMRPDGVIELVGRADRQVKIRGHRVDPAAVESVLREHPSVLDALVLPRRQDDVATLAAYVVGRPGTEVDPSDLHRQLAERLAAPSIPSRMAILPSFPININGKIDVAALPEPRPVFAGSGNADRWNRYDRIVASAYAQHLDLEDIGLYDDFYALGGDSFVAVQVALTVGRAIDGEVPVPPPADGTVRAYARLLEDSVRDVSPPKAY